MTTSDYKILTGKGEFALAEQVKTHLAQQWQPFGGVAFSVLSPDSIGKTTMWFSQAMIKAIPVIS